MAENFSEALARAKQLAAKFSSPSENLSNGSGGGIKRPAGDYADSPTSQKRNTIEEKLAMAADAANMINNNKIQASGAVPSSVQTVNHKIPDNYVGLIIGKKGEQIMRIQQETGCNVQIASDSGGMPDRQVTLTGTIQQIETVKNQFSDIISRAKTATPNINMPYQAQGNFSIDISVPGNKAGLLIGKNGETIKQLQEQCQVKMVIIQDSNAPSAYDKPLRITGDQDKVERAKLMVIDLLNARTTVQGLINQNQGGLSTTFAVPADKTGLVIGKGGETVKEISRTSGAHVEIQKTPPPNPTIKIFNITGTQHQIDKAISMICDKANIPIPQSSQTGTYGGASSYSSGMDQYGQQSTQGAGWPAHNAADYSNHWAQMGAGQGAAASGNSETMPAPTVNPQTGQPDYTMAWVHFYRKQGMHDHADAILRSQASGTSQGAAPSGVSQPATGAPASSQNPAASANGGGGYNWSQVQQWQNQSQQPQSNQYASMWQQGGAQNSTSRNG